jgi:hypothetical protein
MNLVHTTLASGLFGFLNLVAPKELQTSLYELTVDAPDRYFELIRKTKNLSWFITEHHHTLPDTQAGRTALIAMGHVVNVFPIERSLKRLRDYSFDELAAALRGHISVSKEGAGKRRESSMKEYLPEPIYA